MLTLVAMLCAALVILGRDTQSALGVGVALAMLPVPLYLGVVYWADRVEPEPALLLVAMFVWGAGTAFALAYTLNTAGTRAIGDLYGPALADVYFASVSAPIVEETLKAAPLLALLALACEQELDDLVDGFVYAAMVGLGFATSENVLFYGREALRNGLPAALDLFVLRGIWDPFIHPLFTAATGIGVAYAARRPRRFRRAAPLLGLALAMLLHSIWNTGAQSGWFDAMYYALFVPIVAGLAIAVAAVRRKEARVLADHLPAAIGRRARVVAELGSLQGRRALRVVARRQAGAAGRKAAAEYEHAAIELAFLERRIRRVKVKLAALVHRRSRPRPWRASRSQARRAAATVPRP